MNLVNYLQGTQLNALQHKLHVVCWEKCRWQLFQKSSIQVQGSEKKITLGTASKFPLQCAPKVHHDVSMYVFALVLKVCHLD